MKVFELEELQNSPYSYAVLSTSFMNPMQQLDLIEDELMNHYRGKVIFDLLLSNGLVSNRFFEAEFDGEKFNVASFKLVRELEQSIREQISAFYRRNDYYLDNGVLSDVHKYIVKSGKDI